MFTPSTHEDTLHKSHPLKAPLLQTMQVNVVCSAVLVRLPLSFFFLFSLLSLACKGQLIDKYAKMCATTQPPWRWPLWLLPLQGLWWDNTDWKANLPNDFCLVATQSKCGDRSHTYSSEDGRALARHKKTLCRVLIMQEVNANEDTGSPRGQVSIAAKGSILIRTWKSKRTSWTSRALQVGYLYYYWYVCLYWWYMIGNLFSNLSISHEVLSGSSLSH